MNSHAVHVRDDATAGGSPCSGGVFPASGPAWLPVFPWRCSGRARRPRPVHSGCATPIPSAANPLQIAGRPTPPERRRASSPGNDSADGPDSFDGTRTKIDSRAPGRREAETRRTQRPESVSTVHILGPAEWRIRQEPRAGFTKATGAAWRVALEARGLSAVSINVRITAVRKLAVEAADNGLLAPELANGITRVKGVASKGVRLGNWLSARQARPFSPRRTPLRRRESSTGRFSQCPLATGCDVQKWRRSPWRTSSSGMGAGASWPDKVHWTHSVPAKHKVHFQTACSMIYGAERGTCSPLAD